MTTFPFSFVLRAETRYRIQPAAFPTTSCRCGEMADAIDSKSVARKGVGVRVPPPAPIPPFFVPTSACFPPPDPPEGGTTSRPVCSPGFSLLPVRATRRRSRHSEGSTAASRMDPRPGIRASQPPTRNQESTRLPPDSASRHEAARRLYKQKQAALAALIQSLLHQAFRGEL